MFCFSQKILGADIMLFTVEVLRRERGSEKPFWQEIHYKSENDNETVGYMLERINLLAEEGLCDVRGNAIRRIAWDRSCLQKKCGACAMVINGYPALACDTYIAQFEKKGRITVEPLRKFPVVEDLIVDRAILFENLKTMKIWFEKDVNVCEADSGYVYDSSRCLQCGLCLEVCPNFCPGDEFFGAAAFVPTTKLLRTLEGEDRDRVASEYVKHIYKGCGKALSCAGVCPAEIRIDRLLSNSNLISMWRRK